MDQQVESRMMQLEQRLDVMEEVFGMVLAALSKNENSGISANKLKNALSHMEKRAGDASPRRAAIRYMQDVLKKAGV